MIPIQNKTTAAFFRSLLLGGVKKTKKQIIIHIEKNCQKYSENTSLYLPIDLSALARLRIFDSNRLETSSYCRCMAAATLLSNITLPYRLVQNSVSVDEWLYKLIPEPRLNIFNAACNVPNVKPNLELVEEINYIMHFK